MSYLTQSRLATDEHIQIRVAACAASLGDDNPSVLAGRNAWALSAQPGWVDAYAEAEAAHALAPNTAPPPGANEGAVTDAMILEATTALIAAEGAAEQAQAAASTGKSSGGVEHGIRS